MKGEVEQYVAGSGCDCGAWSEGECGCSADWTPKEVYSLRKRVTELEDLVTLIVDSESADSSIIPYLHRYWLRKAKKLKEKV